MLSGDDNLMVNGKKVQSGILNLRTNDTLAWTKERHQGAGNILLGDGSAQQASSADLTSTAGLATNRLRFRDGRARSSYRAATIVITAAHSDIAPYQLIREIRVGFRYPPAHV